ncbi:hypothetical protein SGFS_066400 [Streptomyces graminofaciens]|uniref:Terpene synthase n=1 Tax=Streptomyces graminofaciens TaxID=68212 RepID=A0ABM7FG19_9ACTN|nr:hypothetical protein [Streptomyces graminofaciens]BBC35346.1 hypothetical protein SGFS_066400 [Streptomyces graminofaciens]
MPSFTMPKFKMPLPEVKPSPAMDSVVEDMWEWADRHHLIAGEAARRHVVRTRPAWTTAVYLPLADEEHLRIPNRFMIWAFILDDNLDDSISGGGIEAAAAFLDELIAVCHAERRPRTDTGRALEEIFDGLSEGRSPQWRALLGESVALWLNTFVPEALASRAGRVMTIEEFLPHRRNGVCEFIFAHLQEYVRGIELPVAIRNLPALRQARELACEWTGLFNDIYSVDKEESVGYMHNAVLVTRTHRRCSTQEAVDIVAAVVDGLLDQFLAACAAAPAQIRASADYSPHVFADALEVVEGYQGLVRANFDYHRSAARYNDVATYMPAALAEGDGIRPDWSVAPALTPALLPDRSSACVAR